MLVEEKFNFNIPLEILGKGDKEGEWRIGGIASTENKDFQGEVVQIDGLDISTLAKNGFFNQDHKKGFENILGKIDKAEKRQTDEDGKHLYVEGRLFKTQPAAQAAWNIMNELDKSEDLTGKRMQLSVEGKVQKRIGKDKKVIAKAKVDNIALTLNPINDHTFANFLKSLEGMKSSKEESTIDSEFVNVSLHKSVIEKLNEYVDNKKSFKDHIYDVAEQMDEIEQKSFLRVLKKALTSTYSYASELPSERTGGDVMTQESLDRKKKKKKKKLKDIVYTIKKSFPSINLEQLVKTVFERYNLRGEIR